MIWWRSARTPVLTVAMAVFAVVCVLPVAYVVGQSILETAGRPHALQVLLLDARQRGLLLNSALLATGTAVLATMIGAPLGVLLARVPLSWTAAVRLALAAPLALPPYIVALAWIYASGGWIYSLVGAIVVLSLGCYPLPMLATEAAMRRVDGRLEEAALLVTSPMQVLRRITFPLVLPAVLASGLVVFVLALSEFGVPALLRVRVYPTEVFTAFAALYDFGRAALLTLPLLLMSSAMAAAAGVLAGDCLLVSRRATGAPAVPLDSWRRPAVALVVATILVALVMPVSVLTVEARGASSFPAAVAASHEAIVNSLALSLAGATVVLGLAVWIGYAGARAGQGVGRAMNVLMVVLFAVPGTVVGVGLIALWNRSGPLGAVYGTSAMLLLASLARFVPIAVLAIAAAVRSIPVSLEEAAAVSGAGWLRTFFSVVLPQARLALGAAWVMSFILTFGELGSMILVAPPGESTLPIHIYTMIANAPSSHVAALALLQTAVIGVPLALLGLISPRARS